MTEHSKHQRTQCDAALSYRFRVVDVRDRSESLWELSWNERDMAGWNEIASG